MAALETRRDVVTTLPTELLCRIIDLCRPDDFETIILACKRFYKAARHLIVEHNHCKNYSRDLHLDVLTTGHVVIRSPFDFLEQIMVRPRDMQLDQLRYFNKVILLEQSDEFKKAPHDTFFDRMRVESPQLYQRISATVRDFCYSGGFDGYEHGKYNRNEIEYRGEYKTPSKQRSFLYQHAGLELMAVESLVVYSAFYDGFSRTPRYQIRYGTALKNLREIRIMDDGYSTTSTADILPILRLPQIQLLALDAFEHYHSECEDLAEETKEETFPVKALVLSRATYEPQSLEWLLSRCPNLTTFIWEDYTQTTGVDSEASDVESLEQGEDSGKQDTVFEEVLDLHCSVDDGDWPWAFGDEPTDLFKPALVLELLLRTHGKALKQLGMTINNLPQMRWSDYYIQRQFKVLHFLDFTALTHLEFDIRILRFRRGSYYSYPPLAKVLPTSIKELGIIMNELAVVTEPLRDLFNALPAAGFKNIRKISVRLILGKDKRGDFLNKEAITILTKIQEDFKRESVIFEWISEDESNNVEARLGWNDGNNISDSIDPVVLRQKLLIEGRIEGTANH